VANKCTKIPTRVHKILHKKLKIEQHEPSKKTRVISSGRITVHASLVTPSCYSCKKLDAVPDLRLCLCVLKHRATLARDGHLPAKKILCDGFLLMWCIFKFEGVLFRSDSRHNYRVDSLWECATKQAVMTSFRAK